MDAYSFHEICNADPEEYEACFTNKITKLIEERVDKTFSFDIHILAINSPEVFICSNEEIGEEDSIGKTLKSTIYRHHLFNDTTEKIYTETVQITQMSIIAPTKSLFIVYGHTEACLLHCVTKKRIPIMKSISEISNVVVPINSTLAYFCINRSIFKVDSLAQTPDAKIVVLCNAEILKFDFFSNQRYLVIMFLDNSIQIFDTTSSNYLDLPNPELHLASDFIISHECQKIAFLLSDQVHIFELKSKEARRELENSEESIDKEIKRLSMERLYIDGEDKNLRNSNYREPPLSNDKTMHVEEEIQSMVRLKTKTDSSRVFLNEQPIYIYDPSNMDKHSKKKGNRLNLEIDIEKSHSPEVSDPSRPILETPKILLRAKVNSYKNLSCKLNVKNKEKNFMINTLIDEASEEGDNSLELFSEVKLELIEVINFYVDLDPIMRVTQNDTLFNASKKSKLINHKNCHIRVETDELPIDANYNMQLKVLYSGYLTKSVVLDDNPVDITYCPISSWILFVEMGRKSFRAFNLTKNENSQFYYDDEIRGVMFDENETKFFTWNEMGIKKWDMVSRKCVNTWNCPSSGELGNQITSVHYSIDKSILFCTTNTNLLIFRSRTLTLDSDIDSVNMVTADFSSTILNSLNMHLIAVNVDDDYSIRIWDLTKDSAEEYETLYPKSKFKVVEKSNKHEFFIAGDEQGSLFVFNSETIIIQNVKGHKKCLSTLLLIDSENKLISGSEDSIIIWSLPEIIYLKKIENESFINQMILLRNDIIVMRCNNSEIKFYNQQTMNLIHHNEGSGNYDSTINYIMYSKINDELLYYKSGMRVSVKSLSNTAKVQISKKPTQGSFSNLTFCHKTNALYCLDKYVPITMYDSQTLSLKYTRDLAIERSVLEISEKHNMMMTVNDKGIVVADLLTLAPIFKIYVNPAINYMSAIRNIDTVCLIYDDNRLEFRRLPTFDLINEEEICKELELTCICMNQKEPQAYFGTSKGKILLWDLTFPIKTLEFGSHTFKITSMVISELKDLLISCSESPAEVKVWNIKDRKLLKVLAVENPMQGMTFKESLNVLFGIDVHGRLFLWNLLTFTHHRITLKFAEENIVNSISSSASDSKIYVSYWDQGEGVDKLVMCDLNRLFRLTYFDKIFIKNLFINRKERCKFIQTFSKLKLIYDRSFFLKTYFNIYFAAAYKKLQNEFMQIWKEEKEPLEFSDRQITPLFYLLNSNQVEFLQNILTFLNKKNVTVGVDAKLMIFLLEKSELSALFFLSKNVKKISRFSDADKEFERLGIFKKFTMHKQNQPQFTEEDYNSLKCEVLRARPINIEVYDMCIKWDFDNFTTTSILFLEAYSQSVCDEFVLSPYRHLVSDKWRKSYLFFLVQTVIYWMHVFFYFLFVMNREAFALLAIDFILILVLLIYEVLDVCANGRSYFNNYWNYLDLLSITMCAIFLFLSMDDHEYLLDYGYRIFLLISLAIVTLRGFTFFKVFSQFSHITQMTVGMMQHSMSIIVILMYFGICLSVMITKIQSNSSFAESVNMNFNLVFGGIPSFEETDYLYVTLVVIGSLILPIFLINFLIAKLSGSYNALAERQKVLAFKEMAGSLHEQEIIWRFVMNLLGKAKSSVFGHIFLSVDTRKISEIDSLYNTEELLQELAKEQKEQHQIVVKQMEHIIQRQQENYKEQKELYKEHQRHQLQNYQEIKEQIKEQHRFQEQQQNTILDILNIRREPSKENMVKSQIRKMPLLSPKLQKPLEGRNYFKRQLTFNK